MLIDFHTHTLLSDGVLIPSEQVRRAAHIGYQAIGLTDHVDGSNLDLVIPRIVKVAKELNQFQDVFVIPGAEITHAPPEQIRELVEEARKLALCWWWCTARPRTNPWWPVQTLRGSRLVPIFCPSGVHKCGRSQACGRKGCVPGDHFESRP